MDGALILVVEDDESLRRYLSLALSAMGYTVDARADVSQHVTTPKMALVDLLLGDADGQGAIEHLVAAGVPVVVMTGLAPDSPRVARALAAGAVTVLHKPFSLEAVRRVVSALA